MKIEGFTGGLRVVTEWATRKRKEEGTETRDKRPGKAPSPRRIAQMMTTDRDKVSKTVARTVAIIGEAVPDLTTARDLLDRFHRIIQHRKDERLEQWIEEAKLGLMKSFASGIVQDQAAVKAALTEHWSNGQTEGHNTKLKLVKRQMYGRAGLDLLKARLLAVV
jgi:transposase